jgi:hypothetical protein
MRKFLLGLLFLIISIFLYFIYTSNSQSIPANPTPTTRTTICLFPCWNNIIPNKTTWSEAKETLKQLDLKISDSYMDSNTNLTAYMVGVNVFDIQALENNALEDKSGSLTASILLKDKIVHSLVLRFSYLGDYLKDNDTNQTTWKLIEPSAFLETYGKPDYIIASEIFVDEGVAVNVRLFWEKQGIVLDYDFKRLAQEKMMLCWTIDDINWATLTLYEPNNPTAFRKILREDARFTFNQESALPEIIVNVDSEEELLDLIANRKCMDIQIVLPKN